MTWQTAKLVAARDETATARTLVFEIPGWPGHLAGQHVDIRVTAPDGYQASREYSIASGATTAPDDPVEVSVEELADGEVSPYLVRGLDIGDHIEVRGPVGGYFVWEPSRPDPVQLIAGGSGVVPLMSILRTHAAAAEAAGEAGAAGAMSGAGGARAADGAGAMGAMGAAEHPAPMRLLYSVRSPVFAFYRDELAELAAGSPGVSVDFAYTRQAPPGSDRSVGRLMRAEVEMLTLPVADNPLIYVCGPNSFVEGIARWLVELGHPPARILTERFGGL